MYIEWGGLGDHLQFSNLPEQFKTYNDEDTYIHIASGFRNSEIYDLVWGTNPYIKGLSKDSPNAGSDFFGRISPNESMSGWSVIHGLPALDNYPKIYHQPDTLSGYEDVILVDLIARSHYKVNSYSDEKIKERLAGLIERFPGKKFVSMMPSEDILLAGEYHIYENDFEVMPTGSLFNYFNLINSCYGLISLHSGTHVLGATIKKRFNDTINNICIIPVQYYIPNSIYNFENSEYVLV